MMGGLRSNTHSQNFVGNLSHLPMSGRRQSAPGFTIVETLIVLGVSSFMFISAFALISGKQANASFNQSIRNVQSEMQQVINEVGSGYYVNSGNIQCTSSSGGPVLTQSATTIEQGSNGPCIFLGKALHFAVAGTEPEAYNVYTIAGLRNSSTLSPFGAKARLVAKPTSASVVPDAFETKRLRYGLSIVKMYYDNNPSNTIGAFAIVSAPSAVGTSDGSQQVNILALTNTSIVPRLAATTAVTNINGNWSPAPDKSITSPPRGIQMCFRSGGSRQSGLITVGVLGRQGTVDMKIFSTVDCT